MLLRRTPRSSAAACGSESQAESSSSVPQGGDQQLQAIRAGALDLASSSEIPPVFAAADGSSPNFKVVAVQQGATLNQEVVVPKGSNGGSIDAFASYGTSIITAHQQGATTVGDGKDILSGNFLWSARDSVLKSPEQKVADVFTELGPLKEHLDVTSFWSTDLDADLEKALS
ncbi:hypothetical protein ABZ896_44105 [Streptomyces sp. NPDC047072]|uniref:hypothetical protein n=1 Tax=Streptomyces sp. NPDC047072 TaxID=3154809 RepID=UPI0034044EF6